MHSRQVRGKDASGAADVGVTELVGEALQFISCEVIVIPQHMVVGGTAGALERCVEGREQYMSYELPWVY